MLTMDQQRGLGIFSISISLLIALTGMPDLITATNVTANCSTEFDDLASKSVTAAVVLHGKALYSPLPLSNSTVQSMWTATFRVQTTYKGLLNVSIDSKQTGSSSANRKSVITIGMSIPEADFTGCAGETSIRPRDGYFLFLNGSYTDRAESSEVARIYWISSLPEMFSKTLTRTVKDHCCDKCAQRPQIKRMAPLVTAEENNRISIRCQTTGRPSPQITWYRDGQRLSPSKHILFASKNSRLVIKRVKLEDFGMYWCQAVNVLGVTNSSVVNVTREPVTTGKHHAVLCDRQVYCLNHGTCYEIITLDHKFCECTVNYTGRRCQDRDSPYFGFPLEGSKLHSMDSYRVAMAGLFLATLIFIVLCVIAYCLAQMRYDNRGQIRQQLVTFTAADEVDTVRPNGDISSPQLAFHRDKILYAQKTGSERGESEDNVRKRLPEVLVQLIESDSDRSPGGRDKELQRDIVTVALPTENTLSIGSQRQRLAAISTTPASASPVDLFHVQLQQPVNSNGCEKEEKVVPGDSSQQVVVENCAPPAQHRGSTEGVTDHVGSRLSKSSNNDKNNRNYQKILADGLVMQHSQSQPF